MLEYMRGRERESARAILKTFSFFQTIKIVQKIKTFSHDSNVLNLFILFNKPQLCVSLFSFVKLAHLYTNVVLVISICYVPSLYLIINYPGDQNEKNRC